MALGLASACTRSTEDPGRTVEYYRAHAAERQAMVRACADDPARTQQRADCINARAAEAKESIGSLQDLPPMGLTPHDKKTGDAR